MTLSVTKCSLVRFRHLAQFLLEVADLVAQACCELELELFGGGVHLLAQLTDKVGEILRGKPRLEYLLMSLVGLRSVEGGTPRWVLPALPALR